MSRPKDLKKILITENRRIVIDGENLGVIPQAIIRRILLLTTSVTGACAEDTFETTELGVWSPKSSQAEGGRFVFLLRELRVQRKSGRCDLPIGFCQFLPVCKSYHHSQGCNGSGDEQLNFHDV